jgi:ubiquinone/menaquinone biosynthesis C-methylase UbiE
MQDVRRRKLVPEMEGRTARWYARNRGTASQIATWREEAARFTAGLPEGAQVLEVAPGPGYLAVEIARSGRFRVSGVDISRTFVEIATGYAAREGVPVDFRQGDVAALPYPAESFDLVVCQAAFKNFTAPARALEEMYRVLRPGGIAIVQDLRADATRSDIAREVDTMALSRANAFSTRLVLGWLRRRAHSSAAFAKLAARSPFGSATISTAGVGMTVTLTRR